MNTATTHDNITADDTNDPAAQSNSPRSGEAKVDAMSIYFGELRRADRIDPETEAALGTRIQDWRRTACRIVLAQPEAWRFILDEVARVESGEHSPRHIWDVGSDTDSDVDALRARLVQSFQPISSMIASAEASNRTETIVEALGAMAFGRRFWSTLVQYLEAAAVRSKDTVVKRRLRKAFAEHGEAEANARAARDELVAANLRLVVAIAKSYVRPTVCFADLVQEGNLGLMRAAEKFDPRHKARFATYAGAWIRQGMQQLVVESAHPLHAPREAWRHASVLRRTAAQLRTSDGHNPEESELVEATGLSSKMIRDLAVLGLKPLELDSESHAVVAERYLADAEDTVLTSDIELITLRNQIGALLSHVPERERMVVSRCFGLGDDCERTLGEVAEGLGISRQRVQQIKTRALERLRSPKLMSDVLGEDYAQDMRETGSAGGSSIER